MSQCHLIILGAGSPKHAGGHQSGLQQVTLENKNVLEWQLHTFSEFVETVDFVGGYEIDRIIQRFPHLTYHYNESWASTGSVKSLAIALQSQDFDGDLLVCYSDILLRKNLVSKLFDHKSKKNELSVVVDSNANGIAGEGHDGRKPETIDCGYGNSEFVGLIYIPKKTVSVFRNFVIQQSLLDERLYLAALISRWLNSSNGNAVRFCEAYDDWAHIEDGKSIAVFVLGTKAKTLSRLRGRVNKSSILPLVYFSRSQWEGNSKACINEVLEQLDVTELVVRSSAQNEDGFEEVNAGRYMSVLNVSAERHSIHSAIKQVFNSYSGASGHDEVLIQPMLQEVVASGVVFTRTLGSGAPYYVINYTENGDTTSVTSGAEAQHKVWTVFRHSPEQYWLKLPDFIQKLLAAVQEIENVVSYDALDIEFAVDKNGHLYTLQARPVYINEDTQDRENDKTLKQSLQSIEKYLKEQYLPAGHVGCQTIWSVMTDWNPAEILGVKPLPLAFDLYRYIVTDEVWSIQRKEVGYRDVGVWPLIRSFAGQAYVDVRASLNSFVPGILPDKIADSMVNYALAQLNQHTELHDKVEFKLLPTCLDFDFLRWKDEYLKREILNAEEIKELESALKDVTTTIINRVQDDLIGVKELDREVSKYVNTHLSTPDKVRHLLDVCKHKGTLPFAHLARAGFVAASFLQTLVTSGLLSNSRHVELLRSIKTVSTKMASDAWLVKNGRLTFDEFVACYGHLRPGTYDVSSPTYASQPSIYLKPLVDSSVPVREMVFSWTEKEASDIENKLKDIGFSLDIDELYEFLSAAISGREDAKFIFSKVLSKAISLISQYSKELNVPEELEEFIGLEGIISADVIMWGRENQVGHIIDNAKRRKELYAITGQLQLPPVVRNCLDLYCFELPETEPNYITLNGCRGELVRLDAGEINYSDLYGKIVAIANADPGYDFLFSIGIKGLITAYGGPNSHMAIRAAEFGLPAIIGVGNSVFSTLRSGIFIELDCQKRLFKYKEHSLS